MPQRLKPDLAKETPEQEQKSFLKTPARVSEGIFMEQLLDRQSQLERSREYYDTTTLMAEMLYGNMRTPFEFDYQDGELYGQDDEPWSPIFDDSIAHSEQLVKNDPSLAFELRRNRTEKEESQDVLSMARGEGPNTMIVESDFPEELVGASDDKIGYNVKRKQAMLRVIYRRTDGKIIMLSQTLESSDRDGLEAIREALGFEAETGELLGQRIKLDLDPEEQEFLIDQLVGIYDRKLEEKFGGRYYAGWRLDTKRADVNTYDFVRKQNDLIESFLSNGSKTLSNIYGLAAALEQRFEATLFDRVNAAASIPQQLLPPILTPEHEMRQAAETARSKGRVFSGCGYTIGSDNDSTLDIFDKLGYGNDFKLDSYSNSEEDEYGSLTFECPDGHKNRRPKGKLLHKCQTKGCTASVKC